MKKGRKLKGPISNLCELFFRTCNRIRFTLTTLPLYHSTTIRWQIPLYHLLLTLLLLAPQRAWSGSTTSGAALQKSPSAVAQSMGEAFVSIPASDGGIGALHYNPASSAFLDLNELHFMGRNGISDDTFSGMMFGSPTRYGTFSGALSYYSIGSIDLVDPQGRTRSAKAEEDIVANMNYGKTMGNFGVGINMKYLRSKLVETVNASTLAGDIGAQMKWNRMSFGLSLLNMGSPLKYASAEEPLPMTVRGGMSRTFNFNRAVPGRLIVSFDLVKERSVDIKELMGIEYLWNKMIAIRSGNQFGDDTGQLQLGFGIIIGQIQLDYDHLKLGDVNGVHSISATYRFGKKAERPKS